MLPYPVVKRQIKSPMVYYLEIMFVLKVKKLHPEARLPSMAHPGDLGCDLFSLENSVIPVRGQSAIRTGIALQFPEGWGGVVKDRSSMALARIYTSGGVVDSGYRGEVKIILRNDSDNDYYVRAGDKIAQLIPIKGERWSVAETDELDDTSRAHGGFGSTGAR
jgi:dUTP pyrophosphatase